MLKRWIEMHTAKTVWLLDMEFLMSAYQCNWGNGCKGISTSSPDLGCCANGAYMDEKDTAMMKKRVPTLTPDVWARHGSDWLEPVKERNRIGISKTVEHKTKIADPNNQVSGCVFANRPTDDAPTGCALHIAALRAGESPYDWKPSICWQMPLYVDLYDDRIHILRMFYWGKDEYDWFCAHDDLNWVSETPLYQTMSSELERMVNNYDETAYPKIKALCDSVFQQFGGKTAKKRIPVTLVLDN